MRHFVDIDTDARLQPGMLAYAHRKIGRVLEVAHGQVRIEFEGGHMRWIDECECSRAKVHWRKVLESGGNHPRPAA